MRCIRLRRLPSTTDSTSGSIGSGCSQSFPIRRSRSRRRRRRKASRIRTVFRGRTRSRIESGKERETVKNKGKAASDTDIIRLRRHFCYMSLLFTLTIISGFSAFLVCIVFHILYNSRNKKGGTPILWAVPHSCDCLRKSER